MTAPIGAPVARLALNPAALALHSEGVDRHRQLVGEMVALLDHAADLGELDHANRERLRSYASRIEATASACAVTLRALAAEPEPSPCEPLRGHVWRHGVGVGGSCAMNMLAHLVSERCVLGTTDVCVGPWVDVFGDGRPSCTSKQTAHRCASVFA